MYEYFYTYETSRDLIKCKLTNGTIITSVHVSAKCVQQGDPGIPIGVVVCTLAQTQDLCPMTD